MIRAVIQEHVVPMRAPRGCYFVQKSFPREGKQKFASEEQKCKSEEQDTAVTQAAQNC